MPSDASQVCIPLCPALLWKILRRGSILDAVEILHVLVYESIYAGCYMAEGGESKEGGEAFIVVTMGRVWLERATIELFNAGL